MSGDIWMEKDTKGLARKGLLNPMNHIMKLKGKTKIKKREEDWAYITQANIDHFYGIHCNLCISGFLLREYKNGTVH